MFWIMNNFRFITCNLLNCFRLCTEYENLESSSSKNETKIDTGNDFLLNFILVNSIDMIFLNHDASKDLIKKRASKILKIIKKETKYKEKHKEIYTFWLKRHSMIEELDNRLYYLGLIFKKKLIMKFNNETNSYLQDLSSRFNYLIKNTDFIKKREEKADYFLRINVYLIAKTDFGCCFEERKLQRRFFEHYKSHGAFEERFFEGITHYDSCIQNEFYKISENKSEIEIVLKKLSNQLKILMAGKYLDTFLLKTMIDIFHGNEEYHYICSENIISYLDNDFENEYEVIGHFIDKLTNHFYLILKKKFEKLYFDTKNKKYFI